MSDFHIRWMIRRDLPEVLAIDRQSWIEPWDDLRFNDQLRHPKIVGQVVQPAVWTYGEPPIVGYMVYQFSRDRIRLVRLAVHPSHRRKGIGRAMIEKLLTKCRPKGESPRVLQIVVPEDDLPTQLWLRACGIRARGVRREDEAIVFEWWPRRTVEVV